MLHANPPAVHRQSDLERLPLSPVVQSLYEEWAEAQPIGHPRTREAWSDYLDSLPVPHPDHPGYWLEGGAQ